MVIGCGSEGEPPRRGEGRSPRPERPDASAPLPTQPAVPTARVTRSLLDLPPRLVPGQRPLLTFQEVSWRYWWITPYRHSRLPAAEQTLDVLVTYRTALAADWLRAVTTPPAFSPASEAKAERAWLWTPPRKDWPSGHGMHEVRRALLLAAGSTATFALESPPEARLSLELSLLPRGAGQSPVVLTITAERAGQPPVTLLAHHAGARDVGAWRPLDLSLAPGPVTLTISARAALPAPAEPMGVIALGRPLVTGRGPDERPNLVFVLLDTVRVDAVGAFGQKRVLTPELDALAREGARLTHVYSNAPWTRPSILSLLSSRTPGAAGATPLSYFSHAPDRAVYLGDRIPTLASHLERQGYLTRALVQNYFMLPHEKVGADHGFSSLAHALFKEGPHAVDNPTLTAAAEAFLARHREDRFFLFLLYESAHSPYNPPREQLDRLVAHLGKGQPLRVEDRYRGEVMALDAQVGRIRQALRRHGLDRNTVVVVTSDHGETLDLAHCFFLPELRYNTCYGHSPSPYNEVLRVPLILRGPGIPVGREVTQLTRHLDLVPTLLELLGLPPLPGAHGRSVVPQIRGQQPDEDREVYATARGAFTLQRGRWKVLWRHPMTRERHVKGEVSQVVEELYDLETDPAEHRNVAHRHPAVLAELKAALFDRLAADRLGVPRYQRGPAPRPAPPRRRASP